MKHKHKPLGVICLVLLGILALPAAVFAGLFWAAYTLMDKALAKAEPQK